MLEITNPIRFYTHFITLFLLLIVQNGFTENIIYNGIQISTQNIEPQHLLERNHFLLQFDQPLTPSDRKVLEQQGLRFLKYIPDHTYLVSGISASLNQKAKIASIPSEAKISATLLEAQKAYAKKNSRNSIFQNESKVKIQFHQDVTFEEASQLLTSLNIALEPERTRFDYHETFDNVSLPLHLLETLADEDIVHFIEAVEYPLRFVNIDAQDTSNIDEIHPGASTAYNLDGSGVILGLWDAGGVRTTHEQIRGRATQLDGIRSFNHHASHIAGTMIGSGDGNPRAQGMAPNAELLCFDIGLDLTEIQNHADRISISNHSYRNSAGWEYDNTNDQWHWYGNPNETVSHIFGNYSSRTEAFDRIVYEQNLIMVAAAGNDRGGDSPPLGTTYIINDGPTTSNLPRNGDDWNQGFNTITPLGVGKNIITVGSIFDLTKEPPRPTDETMTSYSSWGPANDGRVKPDLVVNGTSLFSMTHSADDAYASMGGTSSAAPVVSGAIACLIQHFRQEFNQADPDAALMKNILIHTARDGGSAQGPDYRFGWGLMDVRKAVEFIQLRNNLGHWIDYNTYENIPIEYQSRYQGVEPIKVTLAWTDPPGVSNHSPNNPISNLVNDLDLLLIGPDGQHYPWTLDPDQPWEPATQNQTNHTDNIEQVFIENPVPGTYTIRISGALNLGYGQGFSLCVSGLTRTGNQPHVMILSPSQGHNRSGATTISANAFSPSGIVAMKFYLDGHIIDLPETSKKDGEISIFPPVVETTQTLTLDTRQLTNGIHTLDVSASTFADTITKSVQFYVFNQDNPYQPIHVDSQPTVGRIFPSFSNNWFEFTIPRSGEYIIETHPIEGGYDIDTRISLYGPDTQSNRITTDLDSGLRAYSKITAHLQENRVYYIEVDGNDNQTGLYLISVTSKQETKIPHWQNY